MGCSFTLLRLLLLLLPLSDSLFQVHGVGIGINYGQIANNLPSPSRVAILLQSLNISRVKLYDADPNVLLAFSNSNVEFIVGLGNEYLKNMTNLVKAQNWIQQHVKAFLPQTRITCILVGNEPNQGLTDQNTNLNYDNMLYAQIDAVYAAIKLMGHTDIQVRVSETGWPSKGDTDEAGANLENAGLYNGNILRRIQERQGTPAKPSVPVDVYVFALFNEDLKPGPTSERNYGLFYPDGTPVYNVGLEGYLPVLTYSSATNLQAMSVLSLLIILAYLV